MGSDKLISWRDSPSLEQFKGKIRNLVSFLQPLLPLANCHLVQFLAEDQWGNLVPQHFQEDILNIPFKNLNLIPSAELFEYPTDLVIDRKEFSPFHHFQLTVRSFHLDKLDVLTHIPEIKKEKLHMDKVISLSANMKKAYEVNKISSLIGNICEGKNLEWMVDVGSGLGYLSSVLLLEYKYNILALDSSSTSITGSLDRCQKMQTLLNRYSKKSEGECLEVKETCDTNNLVDYKISDSSEQKVSTFTTSNKKLLLGVTKFIKSNDNLLDTILSQLKSNNDICNKYDIGDLGIVGLHTCGNLSPTSLRLYVSNSNAKFLCNVGCCYHMLEEEYCSDYFYINKQGNLKDSRYHSKDMDPFHRKTESTETGFPMSSYLKSIKFSLGRNARNLALKPSSKISTDDKNLKPMFWRALLEVIVKDIHGFWPEGTFVGRRISKKCDNFYKYCQQGFKNIGLDNKVSEDEIYSYYEKYKHMENHFVRFSFLKASLAPLIENLINMDRLLYLKEQGYSNSHLLPVFDNTLSPRCTAVVSFKD